MASGARHVPRPRRRAAQQDAGARVSLGLCNDFQRIICFECGPAGAQHGNAAEGRRVAAAAPGLCAI